MTQRKLDDCVLRTFRHLIKEAMRQQCMKISLLMSRMMTH